MQNAPSNPYLCDLYAHKEDTARWLFVCERDPAPRLLGGAASWRLIARGVEPPEKAQRWLRLNRFYQWFESPANAPGTG